MRIYTMETTKSLLALRTRAELKAGKAPGPGGSLGKLATLGDRPAVPGDRARDRRSRRMAWDGSAARSRCSSSAQVVPAASPVDRRDPTQHHRRPRARPARDISVDTKLPFKDLKVGTQRSA